MNLIKHYRATLRQYNFNRVFAEYTRDFLDTPSVADLKEFIQGVHEKDPPRKGFKIDIEVTIVYKQHKTND